MAFYKITRDTPDSEALNSILQFFTDIGFYAPALKLAASWPGPSYVGHFNERNPFDGPYKGRANHLLDTAYMWGNYNPKYSKRNWATGRAMAEDLVSFYNEKDDLPVFNTEIGKHLVKIYGPSEEDITSKVEPLDSEAAGRNYGIFDLAQEVGGLDELLNTMYAFLVNHEQSTEI